MELYPLTAGGIGRVLYNMLASMTAVDRARTFVILVKGDLDLALAKDTFPEVSFETLADVVSLQTTDRYPPVGAYTNTDWHWLSVCSMRKLLTLEQCGVDFEYIEFPDWGGLGFAATQEKLFGGGFSNTCLAVRLHSSEGVIHASESHFPDVHALALYDIERKALRDCDRVIAQLMPVADHNLDLYGFDEVDWRSRLVQHSPPVLIDGPFAATSVQVTIDTPLLFTSKFQQFKAPDVFVRACVGFMRMCSEYRGEARFLAHNADSDFVAYVRSLIPPDLANRFRFYGSAIPQSLREQLISTGIAVFPSRYESFCLAAYEASLLGSLVVLNAANPAFGADTPWVDGSNCVKYGGTLEALVDALRSLFKVPPINCLPVSLRSSIEPWKAISRPDEASGVDQEISEMPLVSVVIPNYNLGAYLPYTLRSVIECSYPNIEIVVCDDASTDPFTIDIIRSLEECLEHVRLRVIFARYNRGLAGARNVGIRDAKGKYILTLDADDLISPDFIVKAVRALEKNPSYSAVVPQTAYFDEARSEIPTLQQDYVDFAVFHGEAVACGFVENRFSTATMLARRALFSELPYREELRALEDWDLLLRSVRAGKRLIVTNELHFFYRKRKGSMISAIGDPLRAALLRDDVRRIQSLQAGSLRIPAYSFFASQGNVTAVQPDRLLLAEVEAYRSSEAVRFALHMARFLDARAAWLLRPLKTAGCWMWAVYSRLRGRLV